MTKGTNTKDRADLYQEITDQIIAELEAGTVPWAQPWTTKGTDSITASFALPANAATRKSYSGINILLLWLGGQKHGYSTQGWLTYRQAEAIGAQVRKGERSTRIVFADKFIPKEERAAARKEGRDPSPVWFLKSFRVFNVAQIDGLPDELTAPETKPLDLSGIDASVRQIIERSGARLAMGSRSAYYQPATDSVHLPDVEAFAEPINWHRTALHELTHWTGHKSRLDRNLEGGRGSADYAKEELIAEMGAAFSCAALRIQPTVRHANYLASWLKVLKEDKRAIVRAASQASKASDFLLAFAAENRAKAEPATKAAPNTTNGRLFEVAA